MKRIFKRAHFTLATFIIFLSFAYQNCNDTRFQTEAETAATAAAASKTPDAPAPTSVATPAPVQDPQLPPASGVTSTCQTETVVQACPSNTPNCTCTDVLPAGTYDSDSLIRSGPREAPNADGTYSVGSQCKLNTYGLYHHGTVVSESYGICRNYCTVMAKCINGQWQQHFVTW